MDKYITAFSCFLSFCCITLGYEELQALAQSVAPLLVNQLVVIPLAYWPAYFLFLGAAERTDVATSLRTLHTRLPELMRANLTFWLPAQAVQFAYVPVEDQAVYVAVAGVVWNGVLATLSRPGRGAATRTGAATYGAAAASYRAADAAPDDQPSATSSSLSSFSSLTSTDTRAPMFAEAARALGGERAPRGLAAQLFGAPHRYLAPESHALIGKDPHFRKYYVLGRVVHIERRTAEPDNRYSVPPGTQIELLSVETISHELGVDGEARSA